MCRHYTTVDGSGDHIEVEIFQHVDCEASQVTMYLSALPQVDLEFESGKLTPRERQLANEGAILYDPADGAIDIVAPGGSRSRKALAALFAQHLLQTDEPLKSIALRTYDLSTLRRPRDFEVDETDRIHHVEVRMLRLEPIDDGGGRLTVETTPGQTASLFQRLGDWMGGETAAPDGFDVTLRAPFRLLHGSPGNAARPTLHLRDRRAEWLHTQGSQVDGTADPREVPGEVESTGLLRGRRARRFVMTSTAWKTLLRIAEEQVPQISGTALWRACRGASRCLVEFGLLSRTPGIAAIPLEPTHDSDDDAFEDGYEDFLIPGPSPMPIERRTNDPHLYRLKIDRLLRALAQSLGVKRAFLTAEVLPDLLWRLGSPTSETREPIFFGARRMFHGDNFARVRAELSSMRDSDPSWC